MLLSAQHNEQQIYPPTLLLYELQKKQKQKSNNLPILNFKQTI